MQNKDVIYIDVEDDITAIIGKVKDAKEKIVALVPPKRTGVLQSAVNLRLLARAADSANKRLVLISSNGALASLAASAEIPVAKNLHSRPELAKVTSVDDDEEDVIDGDSLPVGDHAKSSRKDEESDDIPADSIKGIDIDGEATAVSAARQSKVASKDGAKRGIKVPDFGSFRKRIAIGVGAGVLVILFLVWANVVAPHATVVVSAKTTGQFLTNPVTLGTDLETDNQAGTIKTVEETYKDTQEVEFEATGTKNVGEKATGTIKVTQQSLSPSTIPAGTKFTASNGLVFVTSSGVTVPASSIGPGCFPTACPGSATVGVIASEGGSNYNDVSGGLSGPSGISASFVGSTSGGTDKTAKVVTQEDVDKAKEELKDSNQGDAKKKLKSKFDDTDIVIESSFTSKGEPKSSPAVGQEAPDGKAKLTSEITYTMSAVAKDELDAYLDAAFEGLLTSKDSQKIYDNGSKDASFDDFQAGEDKDAKSTATLTATAQIGPKIDDNEIKEQAKGKRTGEVIADIKGIDGVSDVEVKLSPFWVAGVPDDIKKISVEFKLKNNG